MNSFKSPLPWDVPDDAEGEEVLAAGTEFFDNEVLRISPQSASAELIVG